MKDGPPDHEALIKRAVVALFGVAVVFMGAVELNRIAKRAGQPSLLSPEQVVRALHGDLDIKAISLTPEVAKEVSERTANPSISLKGEIRKLVNKLTEE